VFIAGGYWRNGVLLAPRTAQLLADAVMGTLSSADAAVVSTFSVDRFTTTSSSTTSSSSSTAGSTIGDTPAARSSFTTASTTAAAAAVKVRHCTVLPGYHCLVSVVVISIIC
jgi:hypothetical protein